MPDISRCFSVWPLFHTGRFFAKKKQLSLKYLKYYANKRVMRHM